MSETQAIFCGTQMVMFGTGYDLSRPIKGVPDGAKVRVRQRQEEFVEVIVREPRRIRRWACRMGDGGPELCHLQAENSF